MPRSFVLPGDPNWKNPEKSRSWHQGDSNNPCASRGVRPSNAAEQKSNVQVALGKEETRERCGPARLSFQPTVHPVHGPGQLIHICLPQATPRAQGLQPGPLSAGLEGHHGTPGAQGHTPIPWDRSAGRDNPEGPPSSTRQYWLHSKAVLLPSNETGRVLYFKL